MRPENEFQRESEEVGWYSRYIDTDTRRDIDEYMSQGQASFDLSLAVG